MNDKKTTFIDLFAGIGGFRLGMEEAGFECVFSADSNKHAAAMYKENFGDEAFYDITKLNVDDIPDFDIMCGGFPCQPFSMAGQKLGFEDTRGTLFFDLCRIIEAKKPKALFLENVKNLTVHDSGKTFKLIIKTLEDLGYKVSYKLLDARNFNSPQSRERIVIIGVRDTEEKFDFESIITSKPKPIKDFLDKKRKDFDFLKATEYTLVPLKSRKTQPKSGLIFSGYRNKALRINGIRENTENLSRSHKQCNRIYSSEGSHPTLSSQESSGRYFILHNKRVRKLTIEECYRFMGFPENFKLIGAKSSQYNRIGNSICVGMVSAVAIALRSQKFPEVK